MADYQTELLVELIAKVDKFTEGLDQAIGKMDQTQKKSNVANKGVSLDFLAMAAAVGLTANAIINYGMECIAAAAKEEALAAALDQVAENMDLNLELIHESIDAITEYGYDNEKAMELVMRFARAELSTADAVRLSKVALDYAAASGRGYKETLDLLSNSIEMGNARALRQLGITTNVAQVYERYALTIGKLSATQLTDLERRQAVLNAVMENSGRVAGAFEKTLGTAGGQMTLLKMNLEKTQSSIGTLFTPAVQDMVKNLNILLTMFNKLAESPFWAKMGEYIGKHWKEILTAGPVAGVNLLFDAFGKLNMEVLKFMPESLRNNLLSWTASMVTTTNEHGGAIDNAGKKYAMQVVTLDELIERVKMLHVSQKDFTGDIGPVLEKILTSYELQGVSLEQQVKKLKELDKQYKLSGDQRVQLAKQIADLEDKIAKDELAAVQKFKNYLISEFASTIASQIDLFGKGTKSMEEAFKDMINRMVQKLVESMLFSFLGYILFGTPITFKGILGFDDPKSDKLAYGAGGKWFTDALDNFSAGYVNQALKMEQTGPVFAAAAQGGASSGPNITIPVSYSPMYGMGSPQEMRKAAAALGTLIRQYVGKV